MPRPPPRARALAVIFLTLAALPALTARAEIARDGWWSTDTAKSYPALVAAVKSAAGHHGMAVVTEAGPTEAAAARGVTIPGNLVIGVFNNLFAVRILSLSTAAMIEAPIRFYVTENPDGTATLSYKLPSAVLAPYAGEGGAELAAAAAELDTLFSAIASEAADE